jgi:hypothetical protein
MIRGLTYCKEVSTEHASQYEYIHRVGIIANAPLQFGDVLLKSISALHHESIVWVWIQGRDAEVDEVIA